MKIPLLYEIEKTIRNFFKKPKDFCINEKIELYRKLSDAEDVSGTPFVCQPTLLLGKGKIEFGENVRLGYFPSPYFYNGYMHFQTQGEKAIIKVGSNTVINNNFIAIANNASIEIGESCLFSYKVEIINSDFHNIEPDKRHSGGGGISKDVIIGNNVWLGSSVKVLKGVTIGDNSVVGAGSIVTKDVPANTLVAGNPAREIKKIW